MDITLAVDMGMDAHGVVNITLLVMMDVTLAMDIKQSGKYSRKRYK